MTTIRGTTTSCFPTNNSYPADERMRPMPATDERAQFQSAVRTIKENFDSLDGFSVFGIGADFDVNKLYAAAQDSSNPKLQEAAKFLLAHPDMLAELDTADHGGKTDGTISLGDVDSQLSKLDREQAVRQLAVDPRAPEFLQSMDVLIANWDQLDDANNSWLNPFDGKDGVVSKEDLDKISGDPNASPELRRAALFLSTNPDLLHMLDVAKEGGSGDNKISTDDLSAWRDQCQHVLDSMPPSFQVPFQPTY